MTDDDLLKLQALCDAWKSEQDACDVDEKRWANHDIVTAYTHAARTALPELIAKFRAMKISNAINAGAATKYCDEALKLRAENEALKAELEDWKGAQR